MSTHPREHSDQVFIPACPATVLSNNPEGFTVPAALSIVVETASTPKLESCIALTKLLLRPPEHAQRYKERQRSPHRHHQQSAGLRRERRAFEHSCPKCIV